MSADSLCSPAASILIACCAGLVHGSFRVAMIRDFADFIDREKGALGLFITLVEPTRAMKHSHLSNRRTLFLKSIFT
jgi:hypothetical protein